MCAKSAREWKLRVTDILTCISRIQEYTAGLTYEQFAADSKTVDAVTRNFEVIGEAAAHIPESVQERYPEMGWFEMRGMRNVMAHEYYGVSLAIIWRTIQHDLPALADQMKRLLD